MNDSKLIQRLSAESDIVFHTATADHLESAQAILVGIEERANQGPYSYQISFLFTPTNLGFYGAMKESAPSISIKAEPAF